MIKSILNAVLLFPALLASAQTATVLSGVATQPLRGTYTVTAPTTPQGSEGDINLKYQMFSFGGSQNMGPNYSQGWRTEHQFWLDNVFANRGIAHTATITSAAQKAGDYMGWLYAYIYLNGGCGMTMDDEGCGAATVQIATTTPYTGTVTSGGVADNTPGLTYISGTGTSDASYLVDTSTPSFSGNLAPIPSVNPSGLPIVGSTLSLPATTAYCATTSDVGATNLTADVQVPVTVSCTPQAVGPTSPQLVPGYAIFVGPSMTEQVLITAVSGNQITLAHHYPHAVGAHIFQGGIAGKCLAIDDNQTMNPKPGHMTAYQTFGSLTGTDILYGIPLFSQIYPMDIGSGNSQIGPDSPYHIYDCAEIVKNNSTGANPTLEPNPVAWNVGDAVINPHQTANVIEGHWYIGHYDDYTRAGMGSDHFYAYADGVGVSQGFRVFHVGVGNPCWLYTPCKNPATGLNGRLQAANGEDIDGPYGSIFSLGHAPIGSVQDFGVITIKDTLNGYYQFPVLNLFCENGQGTTSQNCNQLNYDPVSGTLSYTNGFSAGSNGTLSATGNTVNLGSPTAPNQQFVNFYGTPTFYNLSGGLPLGNFQGITESVWNNNHSVDRTQWGEYYALQAGVDFTIDGNSINYFAGQKLANSGPSSDVYNWLRITNSTFDSSQQGVMFMPGKDTLGNYNNCAARYVCFGAQSAVSVDDGHISVQGSGQVQQRNTMNGAIPTDAHLWDSGVYNNAGSLDLRALNDANTSAVTYAQVKRTGATPTSYNFFVPITASKLSLGGTPITQSRTQPISCTSKGWILGDDGTITFCAGSGAKPKHIALEVSATDKPAAKK